jgi:hypothetical protein
MTASPLVSVEVVDSASIDEHDFNYQLISDPSDREWAESAAGFITFGLGQAVVKVLEAGNLLAEAKQRLPHGQYLPWVQQACGLKPQRAAELIRAADWVQMSGNAGTLRECTDVATLFILSADTTTEEVREWFMERCAAGKPPSRKEVQERKRQAQGRADGCLIQEALAALKISPEARELASKAEHISTRQLLHELDLEELPKGREHRTAWHVYCRNGVGWWKLPHAQPEPFVVSAPDTSEQHLTLAQAAKLLGLSNVHSLRNSLTPSKIKRQGFPRKKGYEARPSKARGMCYLITVAS